MGSCIGRRILNHWITRDIPLCLISLSMFSRFIHVIACVRLNSFWRLDNILSFLLYITKMYIDRIHFWVQYPKEVKAGSQDICTPMFIGTLFTIAKSWKWHKYPSMDEWIKCNRYIFVYSIIPVSTRVWFLVQEYPMCCRATKPMCHSCLACALEPVSYSTAQVQLPNPCAATESTRLEPVLCKRSHLDEKPTVKSSPCSP